MTGKKHSMDRDWIDPDDAPDLSQEDWQKKLAAARPRRGRPRVETPKVSTTIRLDADIIAHFREGGTGWQSRINAALRKIVEGVKD